MTKEQLKKIGISDQRNELVVQSNDLIRNVQKIKSDLSAQEQKVIVYLISKLCAEDKDFKRIEFSISEYCDICGINKSGKSYENIKKSIKDLRNKSWWIKNDKVELLFAWLDTAVITKNESIELIISESLRPFLLELKKNFTTYQLINVLCLNSKYSIKLYELLKSYLWLNKWEVDIDTFRERLNLKEKYKDIRELKRNVIIPCINEINKYTDLQVEFEQLTSGKKIKRFEFYITEKQGVQMTLDLLLNQEERLSINKNLK